MGGTTTEWRRWSMERQRRFEQEMKAMREKLGQASEDYVSIAEVRMWALDRALEVKNRTDLFGSRDAVVDTEQLIVMAALIEDYIVNGVEAEEAE